MSVHGVCQSCGAVAPLEWFLADGKYKQCLALVAGLPREVAPAALRYLALFRPASGRAMSPDKALRLLGEIRDLVAAGHVQVKGKAGRPCPPRLWAEAMEQMQAQRAALDLPMASHTYLAKVAHGLADTADAAAEQQTRAAEQSGHRPPPPQAEEDDGLMPIERAMLKRGMPLPELKTPAGATLDLRKMLKGA